MHKHIQRMADEQEKAVFKNLSVEKTGNSLEDGLPLYYI